MVGRAFVAVCIISAMSACSGASKPERVSCTRKYGLVISDRSHDSLRSAIDKTNLILSQSVSFQLYDALRTPAQSNDRESVPVYLIEVDPPGKHGPAFIPRNERCILLDAQQVADIRIVFSAGAKGATKRLPDEWYIVLTLLHESGHLSNNESGSMREETRFGDSSFNTAQNSVKIREMLADDFAAKQLRDALGDKANPQRAEAALLGALTVSVVNMNFVVYRVETDTSLSRPVQTYFDTGYSHENLELRTLRMSAVLSPERFGPILEQYEESRRRHENTR